MDLSQDTMAAQKPWKRVKLSKANARNVYSVLFTLYRAQTHKLLFHWERCYITVRVCNFVISQPVISISLYKQTPVSFIFVSCVHMRTYDFLLVNFFTKNGYSPRSILKIRHHTFNKDMVQKFFYPLHRVKTTTILEKSSKTCLPIKIYFMN